MIEISAQVQQRIAKSVSQDKARQWSHSLITAIDQDTSSQPSPAVKRFPLVHGHGTGIACGNITQLY